MTVTAGIADVVAGLRVEVARLHEELPRWGLVVLDGRECVGASAGSRPAGDQAVRSGL